MDAHAATLRTCTRHVARDTSRETAPAGASMSASASASAPSLTVAVRFLSGFPSGRANLHLTGAMHRTDRRFAIASTARSDALDAFRTRRTSRLPHSSHILGEGISEFAARRYVFVTPTLPQIVTTHDSADRLLANRSLGLPLPAFALSAFASLFVPVATTGNGTPSIAPANHHQPKPQ
jgi:hypothetical protein